MTKKKGKEDREKERREISACWYWPTILKTKFKTGGSYLLSFSIEKAKKCECKYLQICYRHLAGTVLEKRQSMLKKKSNNKAIKTRKNNLIA